jgi:hypothetical protein
MAMRVSWDAIAIRPDPTVLRPARQAAAPAGLRPCVPADLQLESAHTIDDGSGDGRLRSKLRFRSVAMSDCAVPNGRLHVRLVDSAGVTLPRDRLSSGGPAPTPATLRILPGQLVFGELLWSLDTGYAPQPAHVVLYPGGDTGDVADAVLISIADLAIPAHQRRGVNHAGGRTTPCWYVDRVADPGALATRTAAMAAPAMVVAGEILCYSVTLTNPAPEAVPLSPCPDFAHLLHVKAPGNNSAGGSQGTLNCRQAPPTIGPGESVTFDFEYDTTGHPPGHAALIWRLSNGPVPAVSVQGQLTVTP